MVEGFDLRRSTRRRRDSQPLRIRQLDGAGKRKRRKTHRLSQKSRVLNSGTSRRCQGETIILELTSTSL